jgi:hypothetical protein
MKKQLIKQIAQALKSYGFTVYLDKTGQHGFYTDGYRCVSFGGQWSFCVDFSGNYVSKHSGTGWRISDARSSITEEEAHSYIKQSAPRWATNEDVRYSTPKQHLKTYGKSSGYVEFTVDEVTV